MPLACDSFSKLKSGLTSSARTPASLILLVIKWEYWEPKSKTYITSFSELLFFSMPYSSFFYLPKQIGLFSKRNALYYDRTYRPVILAGRCVFYSMHHIHTLSDVPENRMLGV